MANGDWDPGALRVAGSRSVPRIKDKFGFRVELVVVEVVRLLSIPIKFVIGLHWLLKLEVPGRLS